MLGAHFFIFSKFDFHAIKCIMYLNLNGSLTLQAADKRQINKTSRGSRSLKNGKSSVVRGLSKGRFLFY